MKKYIIVTLIVLICPLFVLAANEPETVKTFVNIPFLEGKLTTKAFVEAMYKLAIALASIAVVIRLMMAGAKYILSDVVSGKGKAKEDIQNALLGLLIILAAVLILGTINPKLVGINFLNNAAPIDIDQPGGPTTNDVDFKKGDSIPQFDALNHCYSSAGLDTSCVNEYETALQVSCEKFSGGKYSKTSDIWGALYNCE